MTTLTKSEMQQEALDRATQGASVANFPAIFEGFRAKGIAEADIMPRINVLTFHAWKAKGRSVKKGEKGVKVVTFVPVEDDDGNVVGTRSSTAVVFHVSQTESIEDFERRTAARRAGGASSSRGSYRRGFRRGWRQADAVTANHDGSDPGEHAADRWNELNGDRWIDG